MFQILDSKQSDLQRFSVQSYRTKLDTHVDIPTELDLTSYASKESGKYVCNGLVARPIYTVLFLASVDPTHINMYTMSLHLPVVHTCTEASKETVHTIHCVVYCNENDLSHSTVEGMYSGQRIQYELYAISNHIGGVTFGHYTALVKHYATDQWYLCNDSRYARLLIRYCVWW